MADLSGFTPQQNVARYEANNQTFEDLLNSTALTTVTPAGNTIKTWAGFSQTAVAILVNAGGTNIALGSGWDAQLQQDYTSLSESVNNLKVGSPAQGDFTPNAAGEMNAEAIYEEGVRIATRYDAGPPPQIAGSGDDTANITAYETARTNRVVDLGNQIVRNDNYATSPNTYKNGWWKVENGEGALDYLVAANRDMLPVYESTFANGPGYCSWSQDTLHTFEGVTYAVFHMAENHGSSYAYGVFMARSDDGGKSWHSLEPIATRDNSSGLGYFCSSAGIINGVQFVILQDKDASTWHMYRRQLYRRIEATDLLWADSSRATRLELRHSEFPSEYEGTGWGGMEGGNITIKGADGFAGLSAGDINISTTIGYAASDRAEIVLSASHTAVSDTAGGGEFAVIFEESAFEEMKDGVNSLGAQIVASDSDITGEPNLIQSFAVHPTQPDGRVMIGCSGLSGTSGIDLCVFELHNLLRGPSEGYWVLPHHFDDSSFPSNYTEPTVSSHPTDSNRWYGFLRTQNDSSSAPRIWWTTDKFATIKYATIAGTGWGDKSSFPCRVVTAADGYLKLIAHGTGHRNSGSDGLRGKVNNYVMIFDITAIEALSDGDTIQVDDDFKIIKFGELDWQNHAFGTASGVGVSSISVIDNRQLIAIYGDEANRKAPNGVLRQARIDLSHALGYTDQTEHAAGASGIGPSQPLAVKGIWQYHNVTSSAVDSLFVCGEMAVDTDLASYDPSTGIWTCPRSSFYRFKSSVYWNNDSLGTTTDAYLLLQDQDDTSLYAPFSYAVSSVDADNISVWLSYKRIPADTTTDEIRETTFGEIITYVRQGQRLGFIVKGVATATSSTRNHIIIEEVT